MAMKKLTSKDIEKVDGGYLFHNDNDGWKVVDDETGAILESSSNKRVASQACVKRGLSCKEISWRQLNNLRNTGHL